MQTDHRRQKWTSSCCVPLSQNHKTLRLFGKVFPNHFNCRWFSDTRWRSRAAMTQFPGTVKTVRSLLWWWTQSSVRAVDSGVRERESWLRCLALTLWSSGQLFKEHTVLGCLICLAVMKVGHVILKQQFITYSEFVWQCLAAADIHRQLIILLLQYWVKILQ